MVYVFGDHLVFMTNMSCTGDFLPWGPCIERPPVNHGWRLPGYVQPGTDNQWKQVYLLVFCPTPICPLQSSVLLISMCRIVGLSKLCTTRMQYISTYLHSFHLYLAFSSGFSENGSTRPVWAALRVGCSDSLYCTFRISGNIGGG